jgi:MFS family permease
MPPFVPWYRGVTRTQWTILAVAWLGWVFDIMDTALFNLAKGPMLTEMLGGPAAYKLHGATYEGWIQAVFLSGWAIGGFVFGVLADKWGRTRALVLTILMYSVFTGLTALCQAPWQVGVVRFVTALGIGGEWAAGAALVAEAFSNRGRAPAAALLQSAAAFGPAFAAVANLALAGQSWRWLFLVGVIPALIVVFVRSKVKEPERAASSGPAPMPVRELFGNPHWRKNAIVAMVVGAVGIAGAGTVTYWQPNLVGAVSREVGATVLAQRVSYVVLFSHVGTLLGVLLVPALCERLGRRNVISAFFVASPLIVAAAILGAGTYQRLLLLGPLMNFFAIGVSAAFVLYFPELFPRRVRATGMGLAYNSGRLLSIPMPVATAALAGALGHSVQMGVLWSGAVYVVGLAGLAFAPETKGNALAG